MATLEQGMDNLLTSEGFTAYLNMVATFHNYSARNVILILAQKPDATRVASFDTWKKLGRTVKRGEKGIKIFFPYKKEVVDEETGELKLEVVGFGIGSTFDHSQTEGRDLPQPPIPSEQFGTSDVAGAIDARLASFAIGKGLAVEKKAIAGGRGYFNPVEGKYGTIAIDAALAADDGRLKTLAHEVGHYLAGHQSNDEASKADREAVAEGSAYVALKHFGIGTEDYTFPYLAYFQQDPLAFKRSLPQIQHVAGTMIRAIEGEVPALMEEWV